MDLDNADKWFSIFTNAATLMGAGVAFRLWWKATISEPRERDKAAAVAKQSTSMIPTSRREFFIAATHNAGVLRRTAKKDADREVANKAERLTEACVDSRDVYLLRTVMRVASYARDEVVALTPGDSSFSVARLGDPAKGDADGLPMTRKEGERVVGALVSSGFASKTEEHACVITAEARSGVQSVVGHGTRGERFIPIEEWDESLDSPMATTYMPPAPLLVRVLR